MLLTNPGVSVDAQTEKKVVLLQRFQGEHPGSLTPASFVASPELAGGEVAKVVRVTPLIALGQKHGACVIYKAVRLVALFTLCHFVFTVLDPNVSVRSAVRPHVKIAQFALSFGMDKHSNRAPTHDLVAKHQARGEISGYHGFKMRQGIFPDLGVVNEMGLSDFGRSNEHDPKERHLGVRSGATENQGLGFYKSYPESLGNL